MRKSLLRDVAGRSRLTPRRIFSGMLRQAYVLWFSALFSLINFFARQPVAWGEGPIVSLTTHGSRLGRVHLAIESILRGNEVPFRIVLWLDDEDALNNLPASLLRLQARGLKIRLTKNYGPHTKYFPLISSGEFAARPLVTADDDVLYPKGWLRGLTRGLSNSDKRTIVCHRAHRIVVSNGRISSYAKWEPCTSDTPSLLNFATGVSGVIYPTEFQDLLRRLGDSFMSFCPKADDVWLHWVAVDNDWRVRQVASKARLFPTVSGTQDTALLSSNVGGAGNDAQIAATYTEMAVKKLFAAA